MMAGLTKAETCSNCGAAYAADKRLKRGRCPRCYAYYRDHGTENPLTFAPRSTRKKLGADGRVRYGKSCPKCDAWISMHATRCASCAAYQRAKGHMLTITKPPVSPRPPDPLTEARAASDAVFRAVLRGERSADDLAAALRAEYRLMGWL